MRLKGHLQGPGYRGNQERLGEAGDTDKEGVAAGQDGDEDFLHDGGLSYDDFGDFLLHLVTGGAAIVYSFQVGFGRGIQDSGYFYLIPRVNISP